MQDDGQRLLEGHRRGIQGTQHYRQAGFWKWRQLGTSCALKNRYSLLETDDRAVDRANKDDAAPTL